MVELVDFSVVERFKVAIVQDGPCMIPLPVSKDFVDIGVVEPEDWIVGCGFKWWFGCWRKFWKFSCKVDLFFLTLP